MANLLATHTLTELVDIVEADLSDSTNTYITAAEVQACIRRAITDINRILPLQKVYEATILFAVTNEAVTLTALATWYSLANSPVKYGSEVVKNNALTTTYTRDTDYYIDYINGKISVISGGVINAGDIVKVSYDKSKLAINIGVAVIADLIRVVAVEYPLGSVPQDIAAFAIWGDYLWIGSIGKESQEQLAKSNHIILYYEAEHNIVIS